MSALPQTDYQRLQDSLDKIRSYGWTDTRLTAFANFVAQAVPSEWHMRILMPAARDRLFSTVATIYSSAAGVSSSRLFKPSSYVEGHSANLEKLRELQTRFNQLKQQLEGTHSLGVPSAYCRFGHRQERVYGLSQDELQRAWM
ncbi:hypothetical protein NBRC10512_002581 [Rhodotorula toruloides]|uniref:RHTO0S03e06458g1_1 n=2 Tax=Rhodotorula toruloides TaxID=5286 RepID=A0A061AKW7_RHOTO|nr:uncharacterized protein RHTO_00320 [Rhodotorula toruloides NP11]EMS25892.1 hypothetical protein RHTO_00320 [Rhodotorula toruloides NP11]KAJ8295928.1 hypothetical protein OF846_001262 [Rhodotorula toruloides]CDR38236.1 RHTO0S03e06458g1_1 [Rhodotorula toruloides]